MLIAFALKSLKKENVENWQIKRIGELLQNRDKYYKIDLSTSMNKTIIYTVITGNYDTIKQPLVLTPGADYFLFTNNPHIKEAGVWRLVHIPSLNIGSRSEKENNILLSRRVKMLAHEYLQQGYDVSVYVDADMLLKKSFSELLDTMADSRLMAACRHSCCASVKEEIDDLLDKCMVDALQI